MKLVENGSALTDPLVIEHMRTFALLKLGVSLADQEEAPAVKLDWLLKINEAVLERQRKAMTADG